MEHLCEVSSELRDVEEIFKIAIDQSREIKEDITMRNEKTKEEVLKDDKRVIHCISFSYS